MDKRQEVEKLLEDMRNALRANRMEPVNTRKNMETFAIMGLLWADVIPELMAMTLENYWSGPDVDRDRSDTDLFWKFKIQVDCAIIYVKLKVLYQENGQVKVVSFHFDNMP